MGIPSDRLRVSFEASSLRQAVELAGELRTDGARDGSGSARTALPADPAALGRHADGRTGAAGPRTEVAEGDA